MEKKSFFQERELAEIRSLPSHSTNNQKDLVERIRDLDPLNDALIITSSIIPSQFLRGNTGAEASRKCYKHGKLLRLPQPTSLQETLATSTISLYLRSDALSALRKMKQEDIHFVGYSWRPVFGNKIKHVVPFGNLSEAGKIFTYAENFSVYKKRNEQTGRWEEKQGIKTTAYPDARRVAIEGAQVITHVPSRRKKAEKYTIGFLHVPFKADRPESEKNYNLAISLSIRSAQFSVEHEQDFREPARSQTPHQIYDIQYKFLHSHEHSDVIRFSPQEIAGYMGIITNEMRNDNITPIMYNPFALPTRKNARFYTKLGNNVLVRDESLSSKNKLRKLHLAEKSILLARAIGYFGHDDFCYWDPNIDGKYRDYDWSIDGKK